LSDALAGVYAFGYAHEKAFQFRALRGMAARSLATRLRVTASLEKRQATRADLIEFGLPNSNGMNDGAFVVVLLRDGRRL